MVEAQGRCIESRAAVVEHADAVAVEATDDRPAGIRAEPGRSDAGQAVARFAEGRGASEHEAVAGHHGRRGRRRRGRAGGMVEQAAFSAARQVLVSQPSGVVMAGMIDAVGECDRLCQQQQQGQQQGQRQDRPCAGTVPAAAGSQQLHGAATASVMR
jgi:hypothetical protein